MTVAGQDRVRFPHYRLRRRECLLKTVEKIGALGRQAFHSGEIEVYLYSERDGDRFSYRHSRTSEDRTPYFSLPKRALYQ